MNALDRPGAVERQLGWIASLLGVAQILIQVASEYPLARERSSLFALAGQASWWNAGCILVLALIVFLAVLGRRLPIRVLVFLWVTAPMIVGVLSVTVSLAAVESPDDAAWLWLVMLTPTMMFYIAVSAPGIASAFAGGLTLVALTGFGAVLAAGSIPLALVSSVLINMVNLGLVAIFVTLRGVLREPYRAEQRLREVEAQRALAAAQAERRERLSAAVHDDVLSVLNAALMLPDADSSALRESARTAMKLLESSDLDLDLAEACKTEDLQVLGDRCRVLWSDADPQCAVTVSATAGEIPHDVADALIDASLEALRNSLRHAGPSARRAATAVLEADRVEMRIGDDGRGFERGQIPPERLGLRYSIEARVRSVSGEVAIDSGLGRGTEVKIWWLRTP